MARFERRQLLRALVVVAGAPVLGGCANDDAAGEDLAPERYFPQSVASGDPRSTSVVLWTRAIDPDDPNATLTLTVTVATDDTFSMPLALDGAPSLVIAPSKDADGCVKLRVDGLAPSTTYYYRFTLESGTKRIRSRVGRAKTAPEADADAEVRFAVVSCQDYGGKYFHAYRHLAEQELDFVLHLGDYVYETTDDPSFQDTAADRSVTFSAPHEALPLGDGSYFAARSLGNYRDLYRTYRSDPDLQRAHELFTFIVIPDDHEFSNDCHGATATYTDGRENEEDFARRFAADRAWFEYMPVDYAEPPASALDENVDFPDDFRIYRSFVFGRRVELVLTDLRRYRPDHVVPEDAFPGSIFMTQDDATSLLQEVPDDAVAYVSIDDEELADVRAALVAAAPDQGFDPAAITGFLSVPWLNNVIVTAAGEAPLDAADATYPRGYAYHQLLKNAEFAAQGARYLVAERPFRALCAKRLAETKGASERLMGDTQRAWFIDTLHASTRTWKVWGNEYALMQKVIDLTPVTIAPEELRQRIVLNADDWDGAPNERSELLKDIAAVENVVTVTGDLHSFFAGVPGPENVADSNVVELIAGSVSSTTWLTGIKRAIAADPSLPPEAGIIAELVGNLLTDDDTRPNPHLGWLELEKNGYAIVATSGDALLMTAYLIDDTLVAKPPQALGAPLDSLFERAEFRVKEGSRTLEQKLDGVWRRWDPESLAWV